MNEQFIDEVMGLVEEYADMQRELEAEDRCGSNFLRVESLKNDSVETLEAIRAKLREVVTPKEMNDGEIIAAYESLSEAKRNLFLSRIGLTCSRCNTGTYKADSNGYNEFHRCDACRHVPMWYEDGTEFVHNNIGAK